MLLTPLTYPEYRELRSFTHALTAKTRQSWTVFGCGPGFASPPYRVCLDPASPKHILKNDTILTIPAGVGLDDAKRQTIEALAAR
jgi:hypothetical protein